MEADGLRRERAAQNELVFRTVNEQILSITDRLASVLSEVDVVCECANASCVGTITLETAEFAEIRESGSDFIVLPGHERPDVERVVRQQPYYVVVRKDPQVLAKATAREA
jgi:hypothetical protein